MAYEISKIPVIKKRTLDEEKLIFTIDMEKGKISIEGILETEYDNEKYTVTRERPAIVLRGNEYRVALDELLPEIAETPWGTPRAVFITNLLEILKRKIV